MLDYLRTNASLREQLRIARDELANERQNRLICEGVLNSRIRTLRRERDGLKAKIDAPKTEIADRIRACRPVSPKVPA